MAEATTWRESAKKELEEAVVTLTQEFQTEEGAIRRQTETDKALYPPSPVYYWITVGIYDFIQLVLGYYALTKLTELVIPIGIPINVGLVVCLLQIIHFFKTLRSIEVSDLAGFSFFGRPWYIPKSGLYQVPWGILTLVRADRNYKDKRFPGPADKIFRVSKEKQKDREGGDMPPEGKDLVRPIFVTTGEPRLTSEDTRTLKEKGGGNPLDQQLSVEISYFVRYRPDQEYGGIFRIARNLSARTGDIDQRIQDLVQEQAEREMKAVLTRHTPATIIENWDLVNKVFILKLRLTVMRLGIDIDRNGGGLDDLNPSHETNETQAEVTREQFRKLATITKAEATSAERQKVREGEAAGELAWLKAQAEGRKKMKEELGVSGDAVLASEAVREVLKETDVILAGGEGGMGDVMRLVKGAQSAFNSGTKKGE